MKTHLPVALRKALLAALVAVSAFAYNRADAADITTPNQTETATGDAPVEITNVSTAAENLTLKSENGDISIEKIVPSGTDTRLEGLTVESTGGGLSIAEVVATEAEGKKTPLSISNAAIDVAGDFIIGTSGTDAGPVQLRGDDSSEIIVGGNMKVHQSVSIAPGLDEGTSSATLVGTSTVDVEGDIEFNGAMTAIQGGSAADSAKITAGGDILFNNEGGTTIADNAIVTSESGKVEIKNAQSVTDIVGDIYAEKGSITAEAGNITVIQMDEKTVVFKASDDIKLVASETSNVVAGDFTANSITVSGDNAIVSSSEMKGEQKVEIAGTNVTALNSSTIVNSGQVNIGGATGETTVDASKISSSADAQVGGATVLVTAGSDIISSGSDKTVSITATGTDADADHPALDIDGASISNVNGTVNITAADGTVDVDATTVTGAETVISGKDVSVTGKGVTGTAAVAISGTNSTAIDDVDVKGDGTATIGTTTGATTVDNSSVDADGAVQISGTSVAIAGNEGIDAGQGSVTIAASAGDASISGGAVKGEGEITISGTDSTSVSDVDVKGDGPATIGATIGATTMTDSSVNVDADVKIEGSSVTVTGNEGIDAGKGSVTITASADDAYIAGDKVEGDGDISITASQSNTLAGVDIDGGSAVTVSGATVQVTAGSDISSSGSDKTVSITATGADADADHPALDIDGASIRNVKGEVNITADAGTVDMTDTEVQGNEAAISGKDVSIRGGNVQTSGAASIKGVDSNTISGDAWVTALKDSVTIDGGTTAANTIEGADTLVDARTTVDIDGATNTIQDGADVVAGTDVTIDAAQSNVVQGGATVTAGTGIAITAEGTAANNGNLISDATLTSASGDIDVTAAGGNDISAGSSVTATAGNVKITGATVNVVAGADTVVTAGDGAVAIDGGDTAINVVDDAKLDAVGTAGIVDMDGASNIVRNGADVLADAGISIDSNSTVAGNGNQISASKVETEKGNIGISSKLANVIQTDSTVTASTGAVTITGTTNNTIEGAGTVVTAGDAVTINGGTTALNIVNASTIDANGGSGVVDMKGDSNAIVQDASVLADSGITIDSAGADAASGNVIAGSTVQTASGDVEMTAANINLVENGSLVDAATGKVTMNGSANVIRTDAQVLAETGVDITSTGTDANIDGNLISAASVQTDTGDVTILAKNANKVTGEGAKVSALAGNIGLSASQNLVDDKAALTAQENVSLVADTKNTVSDASVTAVNGSIAIGDENGSTATVQNVITSTAGKTTTLTAGKNVTIVGKNTINGAAPGSTSIVAQNGDITINDDNYIKYAEIDAQGAEGDVYITTGSGDKTTWIEDTSIMGETVTIAGDISEIRSDDNPAVVKGSGMQIFSAGEDNGAGITLNNVSVQDTGKGTNNLSAANDGHIVIVNRVDVANGTLTIQSSDSYDSGAGRILVDGSNVLNMKAASSLDGRLSGDGCINKSGGDELLLDRDHTEFSGTIYANGAEGGPEGSVVDTDNAGSWIRVTDAGVGAGAGMVLKNTDLVIDTAETTIGSLDTTQDAVANSTATGGTLGTDASYTTDGNTRADFKTIGSVVEVNKGVSGDVVHAAHLALSDATLLKLDATVDGEGNASSDIIAATGNVDMAASTGLNSTSTAAAPSTARVFINHTDMAAAANAAEGTRTTIMSGTMVSDVNADVLYEVEESSNGTYQRKLQDRNVHLENNGDRVDLVFSKNYRSAAKDATMQTVADAIRQYSDAFHHSEGTLASGNSQLEKLVDAFDYTRSEGAAQRGLQSVAGFGNVLPQLMLFDSSRHHLNNLRKQMEMPVCPRTWKGAPNRKSNAWVTYTGAYDSLDGDAHLGDYTRSAHGAMLGVDTSVNCKTRVGLSLGYEAGSGESDAAKVDADTFFVDAYAAACTGHIKHRASIGIAASSFDSRRSVAVEAGYHSFYGTSRADTDALTFNIGYEISSDRKLNERSWLTRYAALNLAWHNLDDMRETGLGGADLVTEYDKEWQAAVALGLAYNREFAVVKYEAPAVFYANAAVHFELLADQASATNRFNASASGWQIESMEREQLYFELGAGVMVPLSPAWTATAGAAVEIGSDRTSFSGNVGVRYTF